MSNNQRLSPNSLLKKFTSKKEVSDDFEFNEFLNKVKSIDNGLSLAELREIKESISTCQLSDALLSLTGFNGVIPDIKPINGNSIIGRVSTVLTDELDWGTSLAGIENTKVGEVLFIKVIGGDAAIWGELTSTTSLEQGLAGTVIYGACRDYEDIQDLEYPVFSKSVVPNAGKPLNKGEVGISLDLDGIIINPGDYIVGDACGVVLIPQNIFDEAMSALWDIKVKEKQIISNIKEGKTLFDIVFCDE